MIIELSAAALIFGLYKRCKNKKLYYKNKLNELYKRNKTFINVMNEVPNLMDHQAMVFGDRLILDISKIMSLDEFINKRNTLETFFKCKVEIEKISNGDIQVDLISKNLFDKEFELIKTKENELYCGLDKEFKPIISNMDYFTNVLISGDIGTGKSTFLLSMLYNLLENNCDISLLLVQLIKSDLTLLKDYKQVRLIITDLEQLKSSLLNLESTLKYREEIIKKVSHLRINDIKSYNQNFPNNKLKYIYVVIEEFSYLSVNKSDSKEVKELKNSILNSLVKIVNVARAFGVILIIAIQKATSDTLDTRIKAQLRTRIVFKQDNTTSNVLIKNDTENLRNRECIVKLDKEITSIAPIFKINSI